MVLLPVAAWSRALVALFFTIPLVTAHEDKLYTSSVTYCAPPRAILIQEFNIQYVRANSSVIFNIAAASVEKDLNVTGNLMLNIYGMNSVNVTFDFCSIAQGILCPLPTYNFNGSGVIPLDFYANLLGGDVSQHVPSLAWVVPDIEAFAQLTLTRVEDGEVVACIQSTLSNGWSLHQPPVSWTTNVIAFVALLASLFQSRFQLASLTAITTAPTSPSYATTRLLDLLHFLQHICITGLVSVNYPLAYRQFVLNFAWAFGFIRIGPFQRAIDNLRHHTGGTLPDGSLDSIDYTNRRLSPYNLLPPESTAGHVNLAVPAVVTSKQADALPPGIPTFVNSLRISNQNAFLTIFFTLLLLAAAAIVFFGAVYAMLAAVRRVRGDRAPEWVVRMREDYRQVLKGHAVLLAFVCLMPVMVFAFFQWSFKDSWFATLVSVLLVIPVIGGCVYPLARTFLASRRVGSPALSSLSELSYIAPVTFGQFRPQRWSFTDLTIISFFVKALVIVLGRPHGLFQIIFLLSLEVLFCVALCVARPYKSKGGDAMAIFLAVIRIVTVGLLIPFAQSLSIKPIPRAALGMGSAVVSSVTVVVLFVSIIINGLWGTFHVPRIPLPWRRHPRSPSPDSAGSSTKRGSADSWGAGDKPWTPTSPTASAKAHLASLPPRPGPPELESRFVTPVRDLGPQYADAPYSASGMSEFTVTDYSHSQYAPSSPGHHQPSSNRHSSASISSYGVWNGMTTASAPSTPGGSSAYHSAATHSQRLEAVDESEYISDTDRQTSSGSMSSRTERGEVQRR